MQPLRLLHTLHFVLGQYRRTDIFFQIAVHFPTQKWMQICSQFSTILIIRPGGKAFTKFQSTFGTQLIQYFLVSAAKVLRCILCN